MKRNIIITGFDEKLSESIACALADRLSMYYLSVGALALYHANRETREMIIAEGGTYQYEKFFDAAIKDALEFEGTVGAVDFADLNPRQIEDLKKNSFIIFIGFSYSALVKRGIEIKESLCNFSRYKYKNVYDLFLYGDAAAKEKPIQKILDGITSYYGG